MNNLNYYKKIAGSFHEVIVEDNYAFCIKSGGLIILDISSLDNIKELYFHPIFGVKAFCVKYEQKLIIVKTNKTFLTFNFDDITNVKVSLTDNLDTEVFDPKVFNECCFEKYLVKSEEYTIFIYDKSSNNLVSKIDLKEKIRILKTYQSYIVVGYAQKGLEFYTYKNNVLHLEHFISILGYNFIDDFYIYHNTIFIADVLGLRVVDISNLSKPEFKKGYLYNGWPKDIIVRNNFLYVADVYGIKIFNIKSDYEICGKIETQYNRTAKIFLQDDYLYLSDEATGLKIVDIKNNYEPKVISVLPLEHGLWDCVVEDNLAYLAGYKGGLKIADVTNKKNLVIINEIHFDKDVIGVHKSKDYLFVANSEDGVVIIDATLPRDLKIISKIKISTGKSWTVTSNDKFLFSANGKNGVSIFSLSDVTSPRLLKNIDTVEARDIIIKNNLLYVADGSAGLKMYDISNISNPELIFSYPSSGFTRGIWVDDNKIYLADGDGGIEILSV